MDHQPNPSTTPTEVPLAFTCGGDRLAGSLHLPAGPGPFPAVVMAQGSGPADRDSGGYFGPIRATFLDRGLATFAFDKPGCGRSSGDWRRHGLSDRAEQIVAGLAAVRAHSAIDGERVGLWGHSQGGWLVQMLAGRRLPLAFAVAGSAPTITVREQIRYDIEHALIGLGHDDEAVEEALAFVTAVHGAADDGVPLDEVRRRLLDPAAGRPWFDDVPTADDAADWEHLRRLIGEPFEPTAA
ncbi:MAG: alpha/beta fold hydrolase, partial [Actinomycetota bacterium]